MTTNLTVRTVGARRVPAPFGLFSVLDFREPDGVRWEGGGVNWENILLEQMGTIGPLQSPQEDTVGLPKTLTDSGFEADYFSEAKEFTVYSSHVGSPLAWDLESAQIKASATFEAFEESLVEAEFWTGTAGAEPNLSDAVVSLDTYDNSVHDLRLAVARLEQHIAETYVSRGVIHTSRQIASLLLSHKAVEASGSRLLTKLGTPVVAGTGYPVGQIKATPALFGYRSDIFTSSTRAGDLLDQSNNNLYAVAERTYLIGFDPYGVGSVTISNPDSGD